MPTFVIDEKTACQHSSASGEQETSDDASGSAVQNNMIIR